MKIIQGKLSNPKYKFAIVQSRFNESICNRLLDGAFSCLKKYSVPEKNIDIFQVPGAFEIPLVASKLASKKKYNAIICIGAVIRGETAHFDYISEVVSSGIKDVALKHSIPVIFGVLTTNTVKQAIERSAKNNNKGWDAALTAIEMADLMKTLNKKSN